MLIQVEWSVFQYNLTYAARAMRRNDQGECYKNKKLGVERYIIH